MWKNFLLTRVEKSTPETFATPLGFKFRRILKPALRPILRLASGRRIHVEAYGFPRTSRGKVDYRALEREAQKEMEN